MIPRPPRATRTDTLFPYTTLFRSPANGRTVYRGHLFVGEQLLSDSPMRDHPLTPMRDSNLLRVLQRQSRGRVGLVPFASVEPGAAALSAALAVSESAGHRLMLVDAVGDRHRREIGAAESGRESCRERVWP